MLCFFIFISICHWNLISLTAHNFSKLTLLKTYNSTYKHDFMSLSETYLDSTTPDSLLEVERYNLLRVDHSNNIKRSKVCIYYKGSLPSRVISLPYLNQALLLEVTYNNKKLIVSVIYISSSQNNNEWESFLSNFEQFLININKLKTSLSVIITGDFSARTSSWLANGFNTTEESKLFSLTSLNRFSQLIN